VAVKITHGHTKSPARRRYIDVVESAPENVTDAELKCDLLRIQIQAQIRKRCLSSNDIKIRIRGKLVQCFLINVRREIGKLRRIALERQHGYGVADHANQPISLVGQWLGDRACR